MKKIIAILLELIPIVSIVAAVVLFLSSINIKALLGILLLISVLGFQFFLIAWKIYKSKLIKILGIIDIFVSLFVIGFYITAFFTFGL